MSAAGRLAGRVLCARSRHARQRVPQSEHRREIEQLQWHKLQRLLKRTLAQSRFYAAKLGWAGPPPDPERNPQTPRPIRFLVRRGDRGRRPGEGVAPGAWSQIPNVRSLRDYTERFPVTTKAELIQDQLLHPPYGSNLTFSLECYPRCHQTSGSTGAPLRWLDTAESWQHLLGNWRRIFRAAGVTSADRFLFAFSFGPFIGFWSGLESALDLGCFCFPAGSMTSQARLRAILDHRITALASTPTYALHLGEVARAEGIDLSSSAVRRILVAGEPGGSLPTTRARLADLWPNAQVIDHYGMTETGPTTYQCPAQPGVLHLIESAYLAEILDPATLRPATPGGTGELVLTTLDRTGSPLLRYRTGDLVRSGSRERCACGTADRALIGGILGRSDDMVIVRGVNVYPSAIDELVRSVGQVTEYRVVVDHRGTMTELELEIEPAAACPEPTALARRLQQVLQNTLSLRVPVRAVGPGTLPRFEMKARRWVDVSG
jgi:phenylacetate-CoA ligase